MNTTTETEQDYSELGLSYDIEVYKAYASNSPSYNQMENLADWYEEAEEAYSGQYDSDEDFAENLMNDCGDLPDNDFVLRYIDWTKLARDIMYDYFEEDGHYFRQM